MTTPHHGLRALAVTLLIGAPLAAQALAPDVETGLEVSGLVDLDSFLGPLPPLSSQVQSLVTLPFPQSQIMVADAAPGVFSYASSADIGLRELKVFGSLDNSGASALGNGETPVLRVRSEVRDVLTLSSVLPDPYTVTFALDVDGMLSGSGSAIANAFLDFGVLGGSRGNDSGAYFFGPISDTLSVTRTISGASVDMDFTAVLSFSTTRVDAGSTVTGALDNTATMRLVLPDGVRLEASGSGTFGVPIPAIPEPGTWALMLAGLGLVGWLAQRRGASAAATATA